jgi:hypothetical protein
VNLFAPQNGAVVKTNNQGNLCFRKWLRLLVPWLLNLKFVTLVFNADIVRKKRAVTFELYCSNYPWVGAL